MAPRGIENRSRPRPEFSRLRSRRGGKAPFSRRLARTRPDRRYEHCDDLWVDGDPQSGRYWANLVAASLTILLAIMAAPVMSLIGVLPRSYVLALAALA